MKARSPTTPSWEIPVNVAARLQAAAALGEILITEETYTHIESEFPKAPSRELQLKGKSETVRARVIALT